MKPSKFFVIDEIEKMLIQKPDLAIGDLGSGQSKNFIELLKKYPQMRYVGFEPNKSEAAQARTILKSFPTASVEGRLGYGEDEERWRGMFDVVVSLSVLEHVKDLETFLQFSVDLLKSNGRIIHLYDLGHALYPSNLKEHFHVALCNLSKKYSFVKKLIPETKFAAYVNFSRVTDTLQQGGVKIEKVTWHNNPSLVALLKNTHTSDLHEILSLVNILEEKISATTKDIHILEKMLPAVCIWGTKKG
ncbi:MAG: class I SAM-dependent methyltransferase [Candidatus Campbellbacteria bacterium]|nr:class I SAM-dependent methyltransferase [Candidatus Campbellbacteria bacterium]